MCRNLIKITKIDKMTNKKIVYDTILPDINSDETIIIILVCGARNSKDQHHRSAEASISGWKRTVSISYRYDQNM
jgi:hypothetical protein